MKGIASEGFKSEAMASGDYWFEFKVDGSREFWLRDKLLSSRLINHNERYKHIFDALKGIDAVLDGEVALGLDSNVLELNRKENWGRTKYFVFDVLEMQGKSVMGKRYEERKELLFGLLEGIESCVIPLEYSGDYDEMWRYVKSLNIEGLVAKRKGSFYHGDLRDESSIDFNRVCDWVKLKHKKEIELGIVGLEKGSEKGAFILEDGNRVSALSSALSSMVERELSIGNKMIAEVEYLFRTKDNRLFQPVIKRIKFQDGVVFYD